MAVTTVEERLSRLEGVYEHLASKADVARVETQVARVETQIADLRTELKGDIAGLRAEVRGEMGDLRTEVKGDIANVERQIGELRAEVHRGNASLIRWVVGFMLVGVGAMTAIVGYLG